MTIPLTFDWLTLASIRMQLALWWRRRRFGIRQLALMTLFGAFSGCVPVTRFEETQSAAQVELEGRRRAEARVAQLQAENQRLSAQAQQQAETLDARDQALSQAALDTSLEGQERRDAEVLVEQLRGELSRASGHLQSYHDDNQRLSAELTSEDARSRTLSLVTRDVALALAAPMSAGHLQLDVAPSAVVVRAPRGYVLEAGGAVKPEAAPLLDAVSQVLERHREVKLRVEDTAAQDATAAARLATALGEHGVAPDRFEPLAPTSAAAGSDDGAAARPEIVLGFSVP